MVLSQSTETYSSIPIDGDSQHSGVDNQSNSLRDSELNSSDDINDYGDDDGFSEDEEELNCFSPADYDGDSGEIRAFSPDPSKDMVSPLLQVISQDTVISFDSGTASDGEMLTRARNDYKSLPWYKRPSVLMISIAVFCLTCSDSFSTGAQLQLTLGAVCNYMNKDMENKLACDALEIQQANATLLKWVNLTTVLSVLMSGKLGKLSDIYGRKPVLIFVISCLLAAKLTQLIILLPQYFSPALMVLSGLISSAGGSIPMLISLGESYVVDVVEEKDRMQAIGKFMAYFSFGLGIGPFISAATGLQSMTLFRLSAFFIMIITILCITFLPESRPQKLRRRSRRLSLDQAEESKHLLVQRIGLKSVVDSFRTLKLLWVTRYDDSGKLDLRARSNVLLLVCISIVSSFVETGFAMPVILYATYQFHWGSTTTSTFLGAFMLLRTLVLLFFSPWFYGKLTRFLAKDLHNVDYIDVLFLVVSLVAELFVQLVCICARSTAQFSLSTVFFAFAAMLTPALHSTFAKFSPGASKNGEFFGSLAFISNIIGLVAPIIGLSIYSAVLKYNPSIIFYICVLFLAVDVALTLLIKI
ncbi:hypothetical protein HII12_002568 [Brettanomyces bruxellensis]|uniref:Major facilitator superfamily (MFS) profile domain-containing protein n=1 Tax=Dekkera bruxellensis TaxID=5007 RepID=A0A8H6BG17_DEKBR|nr:hypothetical protein HII12_002568 [Brettanomyces bruxellensis]